MSSADESRQADLSYYKARYYSPTLGRFLQRDPLGYIDGYNLYSYVSNNPLNWLDPLGLAKRKLEQRQFRIVSSSVEIEGYTVQETQFHIVPTPNGPVPLEGTWHQDIYSSRQTPYSRFAQAVIEGKTGYLDLNVSIASPFGAGLTGGALLDTSGALYPYAGVGIIWPPGPSGSLTFSPNEVSPGWTVGISGGFGTGGQVGIGSDGKYFWEGGFSTPSVGVTGYYIDDPIKAIDTRQIVKEPKP